MNGKTVVRAMLTLALALMASGAEALEMHGYFRETMGVNTKGGGQVCFQLPGLYFKARLGNECDRYLEMDFSETGKVGNVEWRYEFMPAQYQPTMANAGGANSLFVQQNWAGLKFNDMGGATVWAGRRYFKRHDVHSLDWFYWNPAQGNTAVGVEDVNPGFGKLAFTVIKMEAGPTTLDLTRGVYVVPEIRAYDVPVNPDGTLEIGIDLAIAHDQKVAGVDALGNNRAGASPLFTIQHNQANLLGGSNTLAFQYGSGAFSKETGDGPGQLAAGGTTNDKQWRVIEHLVVNPTPEISSAFVLVYQDLKGANSAEAKSFTGEIRPAYQFTDNFKLAADLFYQSVKIDQGGASTTMNLTKLTLAPTIVLGRGYYARPELRFFVTYGSWNQGAVDLAAAQGTTMAGGAFGTTKNGTTVGAQLEIWF